jgi:methyl-accepting chemotaxis protein
MNNTPTFRLKMVISLVITIFAVQVIQFHSWFHAADLFFGKTTLEVYLFHRVLPLTYEVLPIILIIGGALFWRLAFLEKTVARIHRGEAVSDHDVAKAQKDLLAIPVLVMAAALSASALAFLFQALSDLGDYLNLIGFVNLLFDLVAGALFAYVLVGLFDIFLTRPRDILHVTKVDERLGKRIHRHGNLSAVAVLTSAWLLLFSLTLGIRYAQVQGDYTEALQKVAAGGEKDAIAKEYFDAQGKIFPHGEGDLGSDLLALKPNDDFIVQYFVPPTVVLLLLGSLGWWIATRRQAQELKRIRDRMNEALAGGNLSARLKITLFDEVGELASAINALTETQAARVAQLTKAASAVEAAFRPLAEATAQSSQAAQDIVQSTASIAEKANQELGTMAEAEKSLAQALDLFAAIGKSVEVQSKFVEDSSSAMTEMASSISSVTQTTEDAKKLAERLQASSQTGAKSLKSSVEAIRAIEAASREVDELTTAIAKISAQTNLLAMNAAIEAAHAGQSGAGFAVVAQEVRNLALSSSESNKKIKDKTKEMLSLVSNGVRLTTEVGASFEKIDADIQATTALVSEINAAMQEQNVGTDQILKSTAALVDASQTIQETTRNQKDRNALLQSSVAKVTSSFQAIREGALTSAQDGEKIRAAIARLEEVSKDGQVVVKELASMIPKQG